MRVVAAVAWLALLVGVLLGCLLHIEGQRIRCEGAGGVFVQNHCLVGVKEIQP